MTELSELKVPGPTQIELTSPFWDAASEGRLILQHCLACDRGIFYPREICPHCWSDRLEWRQASGHGRLKTFSRIHRPGHPGWATVAPYVVGLVELDEGPTMLSHILGTDPKVGDALRFAPTNIGGRVLPCFETVNARKAKQGGMVP
jgi:uncharacterized protein